MPGVLVYTNPSIYSGTGNRRIESEANLCSTVRPCGRRGKQKRKGDKEENGTERKRKGRGREEKEGWGRQ